MIILTEHIKCPKCGFKGPMNRFSSPEHTKLTKSELGSTKQHKMIVEHYCPKCKTWIKIGNKNADR